MARPSRTLLVLLLVAWSGAVSREVERLSPSEGIESPVEWARGYFQASRGSSSELLRLTLDLDHDGTPEVFIGDPAGRGRNGLPFAVFKKVASGYHFLGELFVSDSLAGFKVLPLAPDGRMRFVQHWAHGGCDGTIAVQTHDGTRFVVLESEKICSGDGGTVDGNRRYDEVFGRANGRGDR